MSEKTARNTLFVRNLSQQVSERVIRETFEACDAIEQVLFRAYPNRTNEFFCQIDFRTPAGVMKGHQMSGTKILGVACEVSVIDPTQQAFMKNLLNQQEWEKPVETMEPAEIHGVQLEHMRKYRETLEKKRKRTVHIAGLEKGVVEDQIRLLCGNFGEVEAVRIDEDEKGCTFALAEFKEEGPAHVCKVRQQFLVDGNVLTFTESKTLVNTREFAEQSVLFQASNIVDIANFQTAILQTGRINQKLAKARLAAKELFDEPLPEGFVDPDAPASEEPAPAPAVEAEPRKLDETEGRKRKRGSRSPEKKRNKEKRSRRPDDEEDPRDSGPEHRRRQEESAKLQQREASANASESGDSDDEAAYAIDVEGEELALVPNTESLVLGGSSSSASSADEGEDPTSNDNRDDYAKHAVASKGKRGKPTLAKLNNLEAKLLELKQKLHKVHGQSGSTPSTATPSPSPPPLSPAAAVGTSTEGKGAIASDTATEKRARAREVANRAPAAAGEGALVSATAIAAVCDEFSAAVGEPLAPTSADPGSAPADHAPTAATGGAVVCATGVGAAPRRRDRRAKRRRKPIVRDVSSESPAKSLSDGPSPARSVPDEGSAVDVDVDANVDVDVGDTSGDDEVGVDESEVDLAVTSPAAAAATKRQRRRPIIAAPPIPLDTDASSGGAVASTSAPARAIGNDTVMPAAAVDQNSASRMGQPEEASNALAHPPDAAVPPATIRPRGPRPWECKRCGEPNRGHRRHCNNCGCRPDGSHPKEDVVVNSASSSSSSSPSPNRAVGSDSEDDGGAVRSIAESPARSIKDDDEDDDKVGSPRSIASESSERVVDVDAQAEDECSFQKAVVSGEVADARARILYGASCRFV